MIGLKIFLIASDQMASHAGFLVHHGVHDVLQRFQNVCGVDACVFGQNSITRSRSYRMDGANHKNNPDHPHNSENSIIHERIILPLTCAFISV